MEISFNIEQAKVYDEVSQTTSYTGKKMDEDTTAFDRISTVEEDQSQLKRFWDECRAEIAQMFMRMLSEEKFEGGIYTLTLDVSAAFDTALQPSMQLSLFSYFVQSITAKWYVFTNKKEAGEYADRATALLEDVREKAFFKKNPKRPTYD